MFIYIQDGYQKDKAVLKGLEHEILGCKVII